MNHENIPMSQIREKAKELLEKDSTEEQSELGEFFTKIEY